MKLQNIYSLMQEKKNEYLHEHFEAIFKFAPNTYGKRLSDMFNDKEDSSIVVENMSEWQSTTEPFDKYITAPNGTKLMNYTPFKHQVESWQHMMDHVDSSNRPSMVVTTGTGSGKTECFMIPIIQDIVDKIARDQNANNWHTLKAIFIYPLNALMHDQKERLEEFIQTTGVDIKYAEYNGNLADDRNDDQYELYDPLNGHECLNRYTMRQHGVDILFINPTMLEYMMLRAEDRNIIKNADLTWIVLDETHTYTGGRATELSLLLRRVVAAFGKSPKEISYLTSSATIGEKVADLVAFLEQLTGSNNFKVMSNTRTVPAIAQRYPAIEDINHDAVDKLYNKSYCTLRELFPNKSKEEAFELLDIAADPTTQNHLKVKVHYFVKSLNKGLCVDLLNNASDKQWELLSAINSNKQGLVETVWCTECGNVMGLIEMNNIGDVRRCTLPESDNLFDDDIDDDDTQDGINQVPAVCEFEQKYVSLYEALPNDNELKRLPRYTITTEDGQLKAIPDSNGKYVISPQLKDQNADLHQCAQNQGRNKYAIKSFKIYAKTLQQDLMEPMLQQVDIDPKDLEKPYKGRQLLSFADSRSAAASIAIREHLRIEKQITNYQMYHFLKDNNVQKPLSWSGFIDMIDHRTRPIPMMYQYLKDFVRAEERTKMALAMLYFEFNRPEKDTLEELCVCKVVYPKLDNVQQLPNSVEQINTILPDDAKISIDDWKDFLKIFLDEKMRQMHTYYQDQNGNYDIDVHDMRKLFSKDYPRRPIHEIEITGMSKKNMMYQLLAKHAKCHGVDLSDKLIRPVLNDIWKVLKNDVQLIQIGQERVNGRWQNESNIDKKGNRNDPWRLNLDDLSFDLVTKYWLCPTTGKPLNATFKGLSPKEQKDCGDPKTIDWTAAPQDEVKLSQWLDANLPVELKNNKRRYMRLLYREGYFISKEHTGQIKREEVYALTEDFKAKNINVLSSSTTFEAGVDIGSLQMVSMANVPPMPANYKQRAGRAGRRNQSKSVCITYCDADSNSLRTYNNPMDRIFTYQNPMPMIDMQSPQILQRHVNSLFLHLFLSNNTGLTNKQIVDFFAHQLQVDGGYVKDNNGDVVKVSDYQLHVTGSLYMRFVDFLTELVNNPPAVNIQQAFDKLIAGYNGKHLCVKFFAEQCKKDITRVYEEIEKEVQDIANTSISRTPTTNADYQRKSFVGVMSNDLLSHLATNQFIPNQGMPVNQVSLGWDDDKNRDLPQRDLFLALSDWAPGRMVPINGEVKTISGIRWKYNGNFIHIYRCQCGRTYKSVTLGAKCPHCHLYQPNPWTRFHNAYNLNIIPPTAFIPGDSNRKLDTGSYTQVEIQLIGESKIKDGGSFNWRVSELQNADNSTTPEIIKYNKGLGHGYAICKKCGKAIPEIGLEGDVAADNLVQQDLNDIMDRNGNRSHNSIRALRAGTRCINNNNDFLRNYFIGSSIQTDYFDMQLLDEVGNAISNEKLVTTMALLLCNYLSENIPCVREDVDFLLHNNNQSFCIFDIVKGGAGYSNKLNSKAKIYAALDSIRRQLNNKMTAEELLTRRTSNYYDKVDLDAARKWLEMEYATRVDCAEVSKKFGKAENDVHHMTKADMLTAISQADRNTDVLLFVQYASDFNYNRPNTISWKKENYAIDNHDICFVDAHNMVPNVVFDQLQALNPQGVNRLKSVSSSYLPEEVYPLAQVGDVLYFTPDADTAYLDCDWATKRIFSIGMVLGPITEYTPTKAAGSMVITIPGRTHIDSYNLFSRYFRQDIISNFMQDAAEYDLTITYTDKHLKSHLGMVITLQFIQSLLNLVPRHGETSIRFVGEEYWDNTSKASILSNYPNQEDRDNVLRYLANQLFDNVNVSSIESIEQHYRDLVLSYTDNDGIEHHLRIMPDGGFQNGWFLDSCRATKFYSCENTLAIDSVPIYDKNKPLLFHVITD